MVLVDEGNNQIGTALKSVIHHRETPLHRGFSVFLFNPAGHVLLQCRAPGKVTWPLFWSNSCCGHEMPGEHVTSAAARRILFELGIEAADLRVILPGFRYRAEFDGIVEDEFCPVMVGRCEGSVEANQSEVADHRWVPWADLLVEVETSPHITPWCKEEVRLLNSESTFQSFLAGR